MNKIDSLFYYRSIKCKSCNDWIPIFALGHYKPTDQGEDTFSKRCIGFYNLGYSSSLFLNAFVDLFNSRNDIKFDFVCIIPTHVAGEYNKHLVSLVQNFSKQMNIPYLQVLNRTKTINEQHKLKYEDRVKNLKDSIIIPEEYAEKIKGKSILIIDNTSTTGVTINEVNDLLVHKYYVSKCVFLCLSLGYDQKDKDFDINPTYKAKFSEIVKKFHGAKTSKEDREKFKSLNK